MKCLSARQYYRIIFMLLLFNCFAGSCFSQQADSTMYYFAAHQDDWQLFMSANAYNDVVKSKFHTAFITLTAGDAGNGVDKFGTGLIPYYQARENGSILSAKFLADINSAGQAIKGEYVTINGHKVYKYVYKNVVCYYLRLPNAHGNGGGYAKTGNQTLKKLHDKTISNIQTIDGTATYASWDDLTNTLLKIVNTEKGNAKSGWINVPDTNETLNKGDHSEHIYSSYAAQDAVANAKWLGIRAYIDYYTQTKAPNLSTEQIENAAALHTCDVAGMINGGYESNWNSEHKAWLPMDYFRVTRYPK
jgi:hypothetical protein